MVFGGCIALAAPLLALFMLRDLELAPWGYALALGIPAVGGVIGSSASTCLVRRLGERRVLLLAGVSGTLWMPVIPLSPPGLGGLAIVLGSEFLLMLSAGNS